MNQMRKRKMYDQKVTSQDPTLVIILIDQSTSMDRIMAQNESETYRVSTMAKIVTDNLLYTVLRKTMRGTSIKNYVDFAVIGYGTSIHSAIPHVNLEEFPINIERLKKEAQKIDTTGDELVPRAKRTWVEERSDGLTPMVAALKEARKIIEKWIPNHKSSYPPTVINLTDGMPNDDAKYLELLEKGYIGDLSQTALITEANSIKQLHTDDGNVIIANCHITAERTTSLEFPASISAVEQIDPLARILFEMASTVPAELMKIGNSKMFDMGIEYNAKYFLYNADISSLTNFMRFGTTTATGALDLSDDTKSLPE